MLRDETSSAGTRRPCLSGPIQYSGRLKAKFTVRVVDPDNQPIPGLITRERWALSGDGCITVAETMQNLYASVKLP